MIIGIDYIGITTPFYCHDGNKNILFHRRSKNCRDENGRWDMGSGKLDFGLTPEENVLKEVKEEYGCSGKIQGCIPAFSIFRKHKDQKTHWLAIPFFILVDPKKVKNNDPEKIDEIKWCTLKTLPKPLHTGVAYTIKTYPKYFKHLT